MRLSDQAIFNLAEQCAPFVRTQCQITGQASYEIIRDALCRIGRQNVISHRTVRMIDDFICNYFC
jgi:hypothetical protein